MDARETALRILLEVERGEKSHIALQNTWKRYPEISEQDRRFILRLVQGTLEKRLQLDWRINQKSRVPAAKMKPVIRNLMRMSTFQLFYMDRVPASAVCNEAVKLTGRFHMQGLKGFVNGVLRAMARQEVWPEEPLYISASVPEWFLDRWRTEYGEEALTGLLRSLEESHRLTVRRVTSRVSEPELLNSLEAEGVSVSPAPFPGDAFGLRVPGKLEELTAYRRGWFQIQDLSSMLVGCLAGIRPGQRVLDVCAAPAARACMQQISWREPARFWPAIFLRPRRRGFGRTSPAPAYPIFRRWCRMPPCLCRPGKDRWMSYWRICPVPVSASWGASRRSVTA